jgi:hypothetical protein
MKTPRDILLEQHRSANDRLDALRANVLTSALQPQNNPAARERISFRHIGLKLWRELFWPCRYAWTGMTALWLVLWVINAGMSGPQKRMIARRPLTSAAIQTMREQRRLLAELIPPLPKAEPAEPAKNHGPRSQRPSWLFKV